LNHHASADFWACYRSLPEEVQRLADRAYEHLKRDERHPSLQLKRVGRFWSARIGGSYRSLGIDAKGGIVWFWIGTHAEYDKLISR
jgi:hypothetical protein